jgi:arylformamidase
VTSHLIDLSVPIGANTWSPPSVNRPVKLHTIRRAPPYWQASTAELVLHTGTHVDFPLHVMETGADAATTPLAAMCGRAVLFDLGAVVPCHEISIADLQSCGVELATGDIALIRTAWTDRAWGDFPRYYVESPYCPAATANWLLDRGVRAIGFDCFPEYCARKADYTPAEFVLHQAVLQRGALLIQALTNLDALPRGHPVHFFAAALRVAGGEGAPARAFALLP